MILFIVIFIRIFFIYYEIFKLQKKCFLKKIQVILENESTLEGQQWWNSKELALTILYLESPLSNANLCKINQQFRIK